MPTRKVSSCSTETAVSFSQRDVRAEVTLRKAADQLAGGYSRSQLDKIPKPELIPEPWNRLLMLVNCGRNTPCSGFIERTFVVIPMSNSDFGLKSRSEPLVIENQTQ